MINLDTLKSWEFLVVVLSSVGMWLATTGSTITDKDAYLFTAAAAGVYALARGAAKLGQDPKPVYETTEFYVVLIGAASAVVGALGNHLSATVTTEIIAFLTAATAIANGLRKPSATQVGPRV